MIEDQFFQTPDGPRLQFRDYAPTITEAGPPVLCLHGLTRNVRDFEELAPRIADLGRRVVVASQRGRGRSDYDLASERYAPPVYVTDMLALLDHLAIPRAVFVGTSMGGLMTLIAAAAAPERLAGAVLNDIGPEINPAGLARIRGYVGGAEPAASWAEAAVMCKAINGSAFPHETGAAFWEGFARKTFHEQSLGRIVLDYDPAIARSIVPGQGLEADLWPLFEALRPIPTLVVRGEISDILAPSTVSEMRRRKPDLVVAEVQGVGHAPFLTEPDAWRAIRAFLGTA